VFSGLVLRRISLQKVMSNIMRLSAVAPSRRRHYIPVVTKVLPIPLCNFVHTLFHGKGKAVPFQAWSGPEGSRKLR